MLERFSGLLGRKLLKSPTDKMLYAAKYLWYADMVAFRETGQSMTGATYAALPHGPQLNNYGELVALIREADEDQAEPLTEHEERILARIAGGLPERSGHLQGRSQGAGLHEQEEWGTHSLHRC